jgi:hypothetical protein
VADRDLGIPQRHLGLGERRVQQRRQRRPQYREQREALGGTAQDQHLTGVAAVARGHGLAGAAVVGGGRVGAEPVDGPHEPVAQPRGRGRAADVHGEVLQARLRVHVAVMPQVSHAPDPRSHVLKGTFGALNVSKGTFRALRRSGPGPRRGAS